MGKRKDTKGMKTRWKRINVSCTRTRTDQGDADREKRSRPRPSVKRELCNTAALCIITSLCLLPTHEPAFRNERTRRKDSILWKVGLNCSQVSPA